ncbi:MAG: hypothetical protein HY812_12290 [Planctomycetes bacterium]|nr:hypothetical protein [Planctomycetota bacterium]
MAARGACVVAGTAARPLACALLLLAVCCAAPRREYYPPDRVRIEKVSCDYMGVLTIDYSTLAETLWHCPGVDVQSEQGELFLSFVRAPLEESGRPAVRARFVPPASWRVTIDAPGTRAVHVTDGVLDRVIWRAGRGAGDS